MQHREPRLDLELRGAGDILGGEQRGNAASVGIELVTDMLREAVAELRGEENGREVDPELTFDVTAFLPDDCVGDDGVERVFCKRFASAVDEPMVNELSRALEGRFGPPPEDAAQFIRLMRLKTELRPLRVLGCEATGQQVKLHLREETQLDPVTLSSAGGRRSAFRVAERCERDERRARQRFSGAWPTRFIDGSRKPAKRRRRNSCFGRLSGRGRA